eukprot:SAG11_NODE_32365_length_284_cov_0.821622_1_plen_53_part_10
MSCCVRSFRIVNANVASLALLSAAGSGPTCAVAPPRAGERRTQHSGECVCVGV